MTSLALPRVLWMASKTKIILASALHTSSSSFAEDEPTHTGQSWDSDDPRSLRFMHNPKQTNPRWPIDLIAQVPPKVVNKRVVACVGDSNPALGHPKIYINLDSGEPVSCIYCGLRYQFKDGHHH